MPTAARKPHQNTGEPRPPRAPVRSASAGVEGRKASSAKYPDAPSTARPVLEWYQDTVRFSVASGLLMSAIVVAFLCFRDWGFGWVSTWWLWIFVAIPPVWMYFVGKRYGISAGADWFAMKDAYVDTYDLVEVKLVGASGGLAWDLTLRDKKGDAVTVGLRDIESNRDLWDLVYNGIVHSVGRGAKTNGKAVDKLKLR